MIFHISIYPEFFDKYSRFLKKDIADISIFCDSKGQVFILVLYKASNNNENECGYKSEVFHTCLTSPVKELNELKLWFLSLCLEDHFYSCNVFDGVYEIVQVRNGYVFLEAMVDKDEIDTELIRN